MEQSCLTQEEKCVRIVNNVFEFGIGCELLCLYPLALLFQIENFKLGNIICSVHSPAMPTLTHTNILTIQL